MPATRSRLSAEQAETVTDELKKEESNSPLKEKVEKSNKENEEEDQSSEDSKDSTDNGVDTKENGKSEEEEGGGEEKKRKSDAGDVDASPEKKPKLDAESEDSKTTDSDTPKEVTPTA